MLDLAPLPTAAVAATMILSTVGLFLASLGNRSIRRIERKDAQGHH